MKKLLTEAKRKKEREKQKRKDETFTCIWQVLLLIRCSSQYSQFDLNKLLLRSYFALMFAQTSIGLDICLKPLWTKINEIIFSFFITPSIIIPSHYYNVIIVFLHLLISLSTTIDAVQKHSKVVLHFTRL